MPLPAPARVAVAPVRPEMVEAVSEQASSQYTPSSILDQGYSPGQKVWEFETGATVSSSPAIGSDGTVYVGSHDKKLYAINGKSGVKLWEFKTGGSIYHSSPAI